MSDDTITPALTAETPRIVPDLPSEPKRVRAVMAWIESVIVPRIDRPGG